MLAGKCAFAFRKHFIEDVVEELKESINIVEGKNQGFSEAMILTFFESAIVWVVETYFTKGIPDSSEVAAEQLGVILDRDL